MVAIGAVVDAYAPTVWTIARRGFVCDHDGRVAVRGIEDPDAVEVLVVRVVATVCQPGRRKTMESTAEIRRAVLSEAKHALLAHATDHGDEVSVKGDAADDEGLDDLDALIEGADPSPDDPPIDVEHQAWADAEGSACASWIATLDERSAALIELRFRQHATTEAIAKEFDCGTAAVRERERRLRRKLRHKLKTAGIGDDWADAALDVALCGGRASCAAPPVTIERVRRGVCTRTFEIEPAPFGQRAAWAFGAGVIAAALWLLMFTGVLPNPADDRYPAPEVTLECNRPCAAGDHGVLKIRAPNDAAHVAFLLSDTNGQTIMLMSDPAGGSISLPFGARQALVPVPYQATVPEGALPTMRVMALFSSEALTAKEIPSVAAGKSAREGVVLALDTTPLGQR